MKVLLLYPPEQQWPGCIVKPNGSLAYPYLGGALRDIGVEAYVYDATVGDKNDNTDDFFGKPTKLPSGKLRTGVTDERILEVASNYDIIGITSIFSQQEAMALHCAKIIKKKFPNKVLFSGGVNAKSRAATFFAAGFDIICTSEAEVTIQQIVKILQKNSNSRDFSSVGKIYFKGRNGKMIDNSRIGDIIWELDKLPIPAWHLLPYEKYWKISRPHGGDIKTGAELKYASMMTSRGCPFACLYCHIAQETKDSKSGPIGRFRIKSDERVRQELDILKNEIGANQIFISDDSIFGMKKRAIRLLRSIIDMGLHLTDVNGMNMVHFVKKSGTPGWMVPDEEVIELLAEVGFKDVVLPLLPLERFNPADLIKTFNKYNISLGTNYMLGFPDETRKEIETTVNFAKEMQQHGIDYSNFYLVMPVPGTPMYDYCIKSGQLPKDFDTDQFQWTRAQLLNLSVPSAELIKIRDKAWEDCNTEQYKNVRKSWAAVPIEHAQTS